MADYTKIRRYESETCQEMAKLPNGTVREASMRLGADGGEPLLVAMDAMLRYAKAYSKAYDCSLGSDGLLSNPYFDVIKGIRSLLNGDGAIAMELGRTTDSKDNGVIESLYWHCCRVAGIDGDK